MWFVRLLASQPGSMAQVSGGATWALRLSSFHLASFPELDTLSFGKCVRFFRVDAGQGRWVLGLAAGVWIRHCQASAGRRKEADRRSQQGPRWRNTPWFRLLSKTIPTTTTPRGNQVPVWAWVGAVSRAPFNFGVGNKWAQKLFSF